MVVEIRQPEVGNQPNIGGRYRREQHGQETALSVIGESGRSIEIAGYADQGRKDTGGTEQIFGKVT